MPFEAQRNIARNIVISAKKQNVYGTAIADVDLTHRLRFDPGAFDGVAKQFRNDLERAGKTHPWATEREELQRSRQLSMSSELSDFLAGWLGAFILGADAISGAGPYTHLCTPDLSTTICPVTTAYCENTADLKFKIPDLALNRVVVSGGKDGLLMAQWDAVGSGKHVDGAIGALPALPTNIYLDAKTTDIQIGPQAAPVTIADRVKSWQVEITQNVIPHYAPGANNVFASWTERGLLRAKFSMVVMAKDVDDIRTLFLNDTIREVKIVANKGAAAQLTIRFPGLYLSALQIGADGDKLVWQIESDEGSIVKGAGNFIEWTAINSQATYLVGG